MTRREKIGLVFTAALCANVLLIPAYLNGYMFFFVDTGRHLRMESFIDFTPPFYNLMLYPLYAWDLPWAVGLVQSGLAVALIWLALRVGLSRASAWTLVVAVGALSLASSLPYQAGLALPDAMTALGILAIALAPFERISIRILLALLAYYCAICHFSHLPILAGVLAAGAVLHAWLKPLGNLQLRRFSEAAMALILAFATQVSANYLLHGKAVYSIAGSTFVFARLQADGMGTDYLRERCPQEDWILCDFVSQLPMTSSDFLWADKGPRTTLGGFAPLMDETGEAVSGTVRAYPWRVAKNAARLAFSQLTEVVQFPHREQVDFDFLLEDLEQKHPAVFSSLTSSKQFRTSFDWSSPRRQTHRAIARNTMYALPLLLVLAWRCRLDKSVALAATLAVSVFANCAVCAIGSVATGRYGARVFWLAQFSVVLLALTLVEHWRRSRSPQSTSAPHDPQ